MRLARQTGLALPLLLLPMAAAASCGSAFCSINTDWDSQAPWQDAATRLDLRMEYIHQDQLRAGTGKAAPWLVHCGLIFDSHSPNRA